MKTWSEYLADETEKKEARVSRERERQLEESKKQTNAYRTSVVEEFSKMLLQNLNVIPVTVGESKINMVSYSALENNIKKLIEQMNGD